MVVRQASANDERSFIAEEVLMRLGDRWSVRVIRAIESEPIRFTDLKCRISAMHPISARVLTRTLKQLARDGLIARRVFPVIPPRVEYRITGLGRRFLGLADRIAEWTMAYGPDLEAARRASTLMLASAPRPLPQSLPTITDHSTA